MSNDNPLSQLGEATLNSVSIIVENNPEPEQADTPDEE
jgi:hypothetical protein